VAKASLPADGALVAELRAIAGNAGGIALGIYTGESAGALGAAKAAADAAIANAELSQAEAEAALAGLYAAIDGLELAPVHIGDSALAQLSALLLHAASLNANDYTAASWAALNAVALDAWSFIESLAAEPEPEPDPSALPLSAAEAADGVLAAVEAAAVEAAAAADGAATATGAAAGAATAELAALEAGVEAAEAELAPLADISATLADLIVKLQEALAGLQPATGRPDGKAIAVAVLAEQEQINYVVTGSLAATVEYTLVGANFSDVGAANLRLSFKTELGAAMEVELADSIKGAAGVLVDPADELAPIPPLMPGYETHSVYINANAGETLTVADGEPIAYIRLTFDRNYPAVFASDFPAEQLLVSLVMSHLDIVYYDSGYEGGNEGIDADAAIAAAVATSVVAVRHTYDINIDGRINLVDVNTVRQYLGVLPLDGVWAPEIAGRCDLDGDGDIDLADLTQIIAWYELTVQ
jgi:hypothetical protein